MALLCVQQVLLLLKRGGVSGFLFLNLSYPPYSFLYFHFDARGFVLRKSRIVPGRYVRDMGLDGFYFFLRFVFGGLITVFD